MEGGVDAEHGGPWGPAPGAFRPRCETSHISALTYHSVPARRPTFALAARAWAFFPIGSKLKGRLMRESILSVWASGVKDPGPNPSPPLGTEQLDHLCKGVEGDG